MFKLIFSILFATGGFLLMACAYNDPLQMEAAFSAPGWQIVMAGLLVLGALNMRFAMVSPPIDGVLLSTATVCQVIFAVVLVLAALITPAPVPLQFIVVGGGILCFNGFLPLARQIPSCRR